MRIEPYIFFEGCAEQAAHFYQQSLGAEIVALLRYSEAPDPAQCPVDDPDKVMHMNLRIGDSVVMGSDGNCSGETRFQGFALTLNAKDVNEAEKLFGLLADGGQVQMPLEETFFSPAFGMLADRFGVPWMIHVES
jgi:PhnB protein